MGEAQCGTEAVEFACTGGVYDQGGPVLICSPDTLMRLIRVSAWYAIRHGEHADEDYEAFRGRHPTNIGLRAFTASAPAKGDTALDSSIDQLRTEIEAGRAESRTARIFQAILGFVFAAVLGHEASHLEAGPPFCAIADRSRVEESGLWSVLLRVSSSDELYRPSYPVSAEVAADRCASRRIRLETAVLKTGPLSAGDQEFVRRAAADVVSTMLLTRIDASTARPLFQINDAYLYPPVRMLALAGEMNAGEPGPMVCGGAAESLVEAAQLTYRAQPGKGLMPDEMEHAFPKGVIDAWARRANWSPAALTCR